MQQTHTLIPKFFYLLTFLFLTSLSLTGLFFSGCASKQEVQSVQLSGNRTMGVGLRSFKSNDSAEAAFWSNHIIEWTNAALTDTYHPKIVDLSFQNDSLIESPENLYQIGIKEIDDLFVADAEVTDSTLEVNFSVINGANLKVVNIFKISIPKAEADKYESTFLNSFKKSTLAALPNPNIYPKSDPQHFANLLFVFSKRREQDNEQSLSCENAHDILQYYEKTEALYQLANTRGSTKIVGLQEESHQITSRLQEASEKVKILKDCDEEAKTAFEIIVDYGKIPESSYAFVQSAMQKAGMEEILKKYTTKPVKMKFTIEKTGDLILAVDLKFNRPQYLSWISKRIPMKFKNWQILSLDPYYALMQKLVVMKSSLPAETPLPLKTGFALMKMTLSLKTLLNGEVYFPVDGKYFPEKKAVQMAYPNSIFLVTPGFENRTVLTKDKQLFQEKGWIALGNCKGIDGSLTEDGLVYRFFGFPCN
jgi:hypothetical protein